MYGIPQYSADLNSFSPRQIDENKRGINVYSSTSVVGITGTGRDGKKIQGLIEVPQYGLAIQDREEIAKRCDAVFGVVTGRMQRIAGLEWSVQRESTQEDRIETWLKQCKQIFDEYANATEIKYVVVRFKMVQNILTKLPDCLPDLSNFNMALLRWKKRIEQGNGDACGEIEDWLHQPNAQDNFDDFIKKWVFDLLVHAGAAAYKEYKDGRLENFYPILGGSIQPLKPRFVGPERAFAQVVPGMDTKIYFPDEIMWTTYMPTSGIGSGLVPLEALVNKVAESLFFDQRAANFADGTVPAEKLAVFGGEKSPFGSLSADEAPEVPLEKAEETRLETLLNEPRKNAIRVLSGYGTPAILDLSRGELFKDQSERQRFIRESVAFVFNASNMEVNLTGSENTSGRSTSEAQASIEREKGIYPIVKDIENDLNTQLLPFRFGSGYIFQFKSGLSDKEQAELDQQKMATQTYSINEVRLARGDEPISGDEYDKPGQAQGNQGMQPDGSKSNPLNIRSA